MSVLRKWILYSTLVAIFCTRFLVIVGGLVLYYFYFILIFNLALLILWKITWFPTALKKFFLYLLASGILGLLLGTNSLAGFLKSYVGITLCAFYSAAFIRFVRFDAVELFRKYAHLAFYMAIIGLVMIPLRGRVVGFFVEPSAFARTCVPAVIYYASEWQRHRRHTIRLLVILAACVLTLSSLGFLGLMFGVFFLGIRYRVGRVLVPIVVGLIFTLAWTQSTQFQKRMSDVFVGFNTNDVRDLNESSFGVVLNALITEKQFEAHPLLGGGLGSHIVAHAVFLDTIPGTFFIPEDLKSLGSWDASSLFLRIVSELGLVGVFGAFWYLWHYFPWRASAEEHSVAYAILCYVFMKFCRSGEWFGSEVFFFFSIYTVIGAKVRIQRSLAKRRKERAEEPILRAFPAETQA